MFVTCCNSRKTSSEFAAVRSHFLKFVEVVCVENVLFLRRTFLYLWSDLHGIYKGPLKQQRSQELKLKNGI